jgi:lysophospholipase L1-like esterase
MLLLMVLALYDGSATALSSFPPVGSMPHAHDRCRIHTDAASQWSSYRWRNAYVPAAAVAQTPPLRFGGESRRGARVSTSFITHEFAYCSLGKGPWAWGASNVSVAECEAQCTAMNCTCFDYMCPYHEAADCECPKLPTITPVAAAKKVACVGDSITAGYLSSCGLNYPNQLQQLLGSGYKVTNYGVGGQTMFKPTHLPPNDHSSYWTRPEYGAVLNSSADVIVLMLGTNDAKADRWQNSASQFSRDYASMLASFRRMPSHPQLLIMVPPPLYRDGVYGMNQTVINSIFPGNGTNSVRAIASNAGLSAPIDLFDLFQKHCPIVAGTPGHPPNASDVVCDWVGSGGTDGCHPDDVGYGRVAKAVAAAVRGKLAAV